MSLALRLHALFDFLLLTKIICSLNAKIPQFNPISTLSLFPSPSATQFQLLSSKRLHKTSLEKLYFFSFSPERDEDLEIRVWSVEEVSRWDKRMGGVDFDLVLLII